MRLIPPVPDQWGVFGDYYRGGESIHSSFYICISICAYIYICRIFCFSASLRSIKIFISKVYHFKDSLKSLTRATHIFYLLLHLLSAPSTMRSKLQGIKALGHFYNKAMNLFNNEARGMGQCGYVVIRHGATWQ
jgi:hypothetical protein